jgi:chemotaxis protein MotD
LDRLPQLIADQAATLGAASSAASVGATPVKELDVQLNPASLGALTVKMRLAQGKLSVVIEAAKTGTAKMIDGQRDAIAERLGAADQPLASIEVKSTENLSAQNEHGHANGSASNPQSEGRSGAADDDRQRSQAAQTSSDASSSQTETSDAVTSQRARLGDLFV